MQTVKVANYSSFAIFPVKFLIPKSETNVGKAMVKQQTMGGLLLLYHHDDDDDDADDDDDDDYHYADDYYYYQIMFFPKFMGHLYRVTIDDNVGNILQ
jgi:hypothetical protein